MRILEEGSTITNLVWDAKPVDRLMNTGGLCALVLGLLTLAFGLLPGQSLPLIMGVDAAFIACGFVVAGIVAAGHSARRAKARRLRVDRDAQRLELAHQGHGGWKTTESYAFSAIARLDVDGRTDDDSPDEFSLLLVTHSADRHTLAPLQGLRDRAVVEAGLAALHAAMAQR